MSRDYALEGQKVHLFEVAGCKYALDVNSTFFFELDDLTHELLLEMVKGGDEIRWVRSLAGKYPRRDLLETVGEVERLVAENRLFSAERPRADVRAEPGPLNTVCMNMAHACNLRCGYCFADRDGYTHDDRLMPLETACRTVDFLLNNSKDRPHVDISFFGGEPLLNFKVMADTVSYALEQARRRGKKVRFHVTTNGTVMAPKILELLKKHNFSVILSLDGPRDVHDAIRCFESGEGSYDRVVATLQQLLAVRSSLRHFTVRSTFTHQTHEIERMMKHLAELGCDSISVEPAFIGAGHPLDITVEDMAQVFAHYDALATEYVGELAEGRYFSFFHLKQMMDLAHKARPKTTQCGASTGYVAVGVDGGVYPCHKFVGKPEFRLGDVVSGITAPAIQADFLAAHVHAKEKCSGCWAKYLCGGGCHYISHLYNGSIREPYEIDCRMMQRRIELGVHSYCRVRNENPSLYRSLYRNAS